MIKKFLKIKGVGRFADYLAQGKGDTQFREANIIYAENGRGKTTLVAILKSLASNDPSLVLKRKTFGFLASQEIEVLCDSTHSFQNHKWNDLAKPALEIFDAFFVQENVYSDYRVSPDTKKSLHKYVVGEEGVKISKEINELKQGIEEKNKLLKEIIVQLDIHRGPYQLQKFLTLNEDDEINSQIENKKREINTACSIEQIKKKEQLREIPEVSLPIKISDLKNILKKELSAVSQSAIDKFEIHKKHLEGYSTTDIETWVEDGFKITQQTGHKNDCPFCSQDLKGSEIFEAYKQYFNDAYNELKISLATYKKSFDEFNLVAEINSRELMIATNSTLMEFWKDHIHAGISANDIFLNRVNLSAAYEKAEKSLIDKIKEPLKIIKDELDALTEELDTVKEKINTYNKEIAAINFEISQAQIKTPANIVDLENGFKLLEASKKRFEPAVSKLCEQYGQINGHLQEMKILNEKHQSKLASYSEQIFKDYGKKINDYLKVFNVNFEISKIEGGFKGTSKEPFAEYVIRMAGNDIKFEDDGLSYSAKHTLSEGDKSSLALAFFLARLALDPEVANKILVLDDPLSSLDTVRRMRTIEYIGYFSKKAKQVIVLSHNDNFVFKLYISENFTNVKTLQIQDKGEIVPWDIDEAMQHDYFATLAKIEKYIESGNGLRKDQAKQLIRIALENDLKFRFHRHLKKATHTKDGRVLGAIAPETGLGSMIEKLEHATCLFRDSNKSEVIAELNNLNQYSRSEHHGKASEPHQSASDDSSEIQGYLKSTLDLIENRL